MDELLSPQHLKLPPEFPRITHKRKSLIIIDDHTAGDRFAFVEGAFLESRGRWYEAKGGHGGSLPLLLVYTVVMIVDKIVIALGYQLTFVVHASHNS